MKLAFYGHKRTNIKWIGDHRALEVICNGMRSINQNASIVYSVDDALKADYLFLSNTCDRLSPLMHSLSLAGRPYALIPFHEDHQRWRPIAYAFHSFISFALKQKNPDKHLQYLLSHPELISELAVPIPCPDNQEVMENADFCIANSATEAETILKYAPQATTRVIPWTSGYLDQQSYAYSDPFLKMTGLKKGEYILQVGRFQRKKNQLASILATRNLKMPLVFIASRIFEEDYAKTCLDAIQRFRKAPTWIITHDLPEQHLDNLRIRHLDQVDSFTQDLLISAYQNAGLHLHPAFTELPGYTYLEAAKLGLFSIASTWTTIGDYFKGDEERICYVHPLHLEEMERLVRETFGRSCSPMNYLRSEADVAEEVLEEVKRFSR